ncbi:MAG TPA: hypothetical protein VIL33_05895 [Rhodothermia bacterium]
MIFLASLLVALIVHVFLGWPWSILGGAIAGFVSGRTGWIVGAAAVGLSWALLVLYNFVVAPPEMARFLRITGGLFGNMSGPMVVVVTVLIGVLIGLLGGAIGGLIGSLTRDVRTRRQP